MREGDDDERAGARARSSRNYDALAFSSSVDAEFSRFTTLSDAARKHLRVERNVVYGTGPREALDLFPAARNGAPLLAFIPSSYGLRLGKDAFAFVARTVVDAGGAVAIVDNALGPQLSLDQSLAQQRAALGWLYRNSALAKASPQRIVLGGHSSGATFAAMLCGTAPAGGGTAEDAICGLFALSGIFDCLPLIRTSFNDWLKLDEEAARRNSPLLHLPARDMPLVAACGRGDSVDYRAQTAAFVDAWRARGYRATLLEPDADHFNTILELVNARSPLSQALLELLGL